jgi:hypothetical protein
MAIFKIVRIGARMVWGNDGFRITRPAKNGTTVIESSIFSRGMVRKSYEVVFAIM